MTRGNLYKTIKETLTWKLKEYGVLIYPLY